MLKKAGLKKEILLTLALLLGAALLLGGMLFLRLTEKALLEQRLVQLRAIVQMLSVDLIGQISKQPASSGIPVLLQMNQLPNELAVSGWWVFDQNLKLLSSARKEFVEPFNPVNLQQARYWDELSQTLVFPSQLSFFSTVKAEVRFVIPLRERQHFWGVLGLVVSLEDVQERLSWIWQLVLLYVLFYGTVLVSVGFVLLQRNLISPVQLLLRATEQVANGDLSVKLQIAGPQEVTQLAESFNRMTDAVLKGQQEVARNLQAVEATNRELQQTRDELIRSEKLASIGQLAAGLAHELGNPLAALIGYLEVLKAQSPDGNQRDILQRSLVETQRIDYLVRELLDYSRPTGGVTGQVYPLVELKQCVDLLRNQGVFSKINLVEELYDCSAVVVVDRHKLQQVLINLLLNAVQSCDENGQVTVSVECGEEQICFKIADNGCGIRPEHLSKIFEPFFTTKDPGKGTGLGLAISHRIVAEAGGKIEVESSLGKGSLFRVILNKTRPL